MIGMPRMVSIKSIAWIIVLVVFQYVLTKMYLQIPCMPRWIPVDQNISMSQKTAGIVSYDIYICI